MLKTKKRLLTVGMAVLVLISALLFVMPAVRVSAEGDWISNAAAGFAGGDGSSESPYKISSASELARMAVNINQNIDGGAYLNKYYELTADIDLSGHEWVPIGTSSYKFKGSFDGNEHTVTNLNISSGSDVGLFGCIGTRSIIKDVVIASGSITGSSRVGSICGYNNGGSIENCSNSAEVSGFSYVGGICGRNVGTVTGCKNLESGKVNGTSSSASSLSSYIGGVCGYNEDYSTEKNLSFVSNCYNYAEIGGNIYNSAIGGICGLNTGTIQNCHNSNKVHGDAKVGGVCGENQAYIKGSKNTGDVTGTLNYVGGICGYSNQSTNLPDFVIENCSNEGSVICNNSDGSECNVGGVCGSSNIKINSCTNSGEVSSPSSAVGGICGELYDSTIIDCSNSGDISNGFYYVGGVCGIVYSGTIENCYNTGNIIINNSCKVGGICGELNGYFDDEVLEEIIEYSKIINCYNTGKVSSQYDWIGGVCGHAWSAVIENCYNASEVSGGYAVSGVCGSSELSTIKNCYNVGSVTGTGNNIGGVCGYDWFSLIEKCYNIGAVTDSQTSAAGNVGSICGANDTDNYGNSYVSKYSYGIKNCYYNKDIITLGGIGGSDTDSVKGLSTIEMTCGNALAKMGFDTTVWEKKPNDKTSDSKKAYYPNLNAFTYVPSVGYETELKFALSDENTEYSYGDTVGFDISALVKFEGMESFTADTNETPLASGKGSFTVTQGNNTVVDATEIYDNTIKNVTSSVIKTSGENVIFTLNYNGIGSDYFSNYTDTCSAEISQGEGNVTVEPNPGNIGNAQIDMSPGELDDAILTPEDKALIEQGVDIAVLMTVITINPETVPSNDVTAIGNVMGDYELGCYIDVSLFKKYSNSNTQVPVTDTNSPITISFEVPSDILTKYPVSEYEYSVFCSHNGIGYPITCSYNAETNVMSFSSTMFSTYALAVKPRTSAAVDYTITADIHVTVQPTAKAGDVVTMSVENGYNATVRGVRGNVIATITGTGSFVMPESNVTITSTSTTGDVDYPSYPIEPSYPTYPIYTVTPSIFSEKVTVKAEVNGSSVTLKWDEIDKADKYIVYQLQNGKYVKVKTTADTSVTFKKLKNGETYKFLVRYMINGKLSPISYSCKYKVTVYYKPLPKATATKNSIKLTWKAVPEAKKYAVYKYVDGKAVKLAETEKLAVNIRKLSPDTEYQYIVRAYVDDEWTTMNKSDIVTVKTKAE